MKHDISGIWEECETPIDVGQCWHVKVVGSNLVYRVVVKQITPQTILFQRLEETEEPNVSIIRSIERYKRSDVEFLELFTELVGEGDAQHISYYVIVMIDSNSAWYWASDQGKFTESEHQASKFVFRKDAQKALADDVLYSYWDRCQVVERSDFPKKTIGDYERESGERKVWLVTTGDGEDGNEWNVLHIWSSEEKAKAAKEQYEKPQKRSDGSEYSTQAEVEEWTLDNEK